MNDIIKKFFSDRAITTVALGTAVIALSFASIIIRVSDASPLALAFYRLFFTFLVLLPQVLFFRRSELGQLNLPIITGILASGFFLAGHFYLWISSLEHTVIAVSVVLVSLHPILVAVGGRFFLGDPPPPAFGKAVFLVLGGTALLALEEFFPFYSYRAVEWEGGALALGGAVMMAGYLLIGRWLRGKISTPLYAGGAYGSAALFLLVLFPISGIPLGGYPPREYLLFLALALVPTLLGHTVFNWALKRVTAPVISLLFLGEPVGAGILALLILQEVPAPLQVAGGVLILIGLYLVVRKEPL